MSKRKAKLKLTPQSWVWMAKTCGEQEWARVQDLAKISPEATVSYIQALAGPQAFEEFEETFRPEEVAARRKAAEEKRQREELESRTIYQGKCPSPYTNLQAGSVAPLWRDATLTEAERAEAAKQAEEERSGTREIPKPVFPSER